MECAARLTVPSVATSPAKTTCPAEVVRRASATGTATRRQFFIARPLGLSMPSRGETAGFFHITTVMSTPPST